MDCTTTNGGKGLWRFVAGIGVNERPLAAAVTVQKTELRSPLYPEERGKKIADRGGSGAADGNRGGNVTGLSHYQRVGTDAVAIHADGNTLKGSLAVGNSNA